MALGHPTGIPEARRAAQTMFRQVATQRVDVSRPASAVFDDATGGYTAGTVTVATSVRCMLSSPARGTTQVDVAADTQTHTLLEIKYDPAVRLQVDDTVTVTAADDPQLVGTVLHVAGVGEAPAHIYGLAWVERVEPDSGA